jgi:hypothetical protein
MSKHYACETYKNKNNKRLFKCKVCIVVIRPNMNEERKYMFRNTNRILLTYHKNKLKDYNKYVIINELLKLI